MHFGYTKHIHTRLSGCLGKFPGWAMPLPCEESRNRGIVLIYFYKYQYEYIDFKTITIDN